MFLNTSIKKEVAVMASSPHIVLFMQPAFPGSIHDYKILREKWGKTTQATTSISNIQSKKGENGDRLNYFK